VAPPADADPVTLSARLCRAVEAGLRPRRARMLSLSSSDAVHR